MTCTTRTLREARAPNGIVINTPSDDGMLSRCRLATRDLDDPEPADDRTVARLLGSLSRGGRALIARDAETRRLVGAAQCGSAGRPGATEVVGVVVAPVASTPRARRGDGVRALAPEPRRRSDDGLPRGRPQAPTAPTKRGIPEDVDERCTCRWRRTPTPEPVATPERRWPLRRCGSGRSAGTGPPSGRRCSARGCRSSPSAISSTSRPAAPPPWAAWPRRTASRR